MNAPRPHHYNFAHQRLPELVFRFQDIFLSVLGAAGDDYLRGVWNQLGGTLVKDERLSVDGLNLMFFEDKCYCGVVIALPKALYRAEAHMIALVAERVSGSILAGKGVGFEYRNLRYFALEHSSQTVDGRGTEIGEWTYLRHSNYGPGPTIDAELFWTACADLALTKTRRRFHKDTRMYERRCHRNYTEFKRPRNTENLLRFCHPAFWALRQTDN